ncbi:MAG: HAD-IC family P-type ATPase [Chlamydiota bacterium]
MYEGLSQEDVKKRLKEYGMNRLPEGKGRSLYQVFFEQFKNPLIYLLVAASIVTFFFGKPSDPLVVLGVALINAIVGTFQEGKAEKSLEALRKYNSARVRVFREGGLQEILSEEIVPGDLVSLNAGDLIPADGILKEAIQLKINEAVLTGESEALTKQMDAFVISGNHVLNGRGVLLVQATGERTELGKIARLAETAPVIKTPIEEKMMVFGRDLAYIAIGVALFILLAGYFSSISRADLVMAAVSEVVSIIPEGLPVAITIALAVGVQRMAFKRSIVRRLVAVETLGSTSVICSDKTGTLTKNEMTVVSFSPKTQELFQAFILCNDASLTAGDPLEIALLKAAEKEGMNINELRKLHPRTQEIPFSAEAKIMATEHNGFILIKGAYEVISSISTEKMFEAEMDVDSKKGFRVLGFAIIEKGHIHPDQGVAQFQGKARFLGIVSFYDPPRPEVMEAIAACRQAGIRAVMVTGDHLQTALAIAEELNLMRPGDYGITGDDLEKMSLEKLQEECSKISVFARLHPEQKLKIVQAFQRKHEVVAVTGDGVNDAPALAQADVGVAMGIAGTDVAKEAAKMVILDDNFATIVEAIAEGRLVYQNIKKVIFYILSTSLAGAFALLTGVIWDLPLIMHPLHILWINVVTEGTVTINLIMDPPFGDEMKRPPIRRDDKILTRKKLFPMCLTILWVGFLLLLCFVIEHRRGLPLIQIQTEVFTLFAFSAWFKLFSVRSGERSFFTSGSILKNRYLVLGLSLGILLHAAVLYLPFLNTIFHTVPLQASTISILLLASSSILWLDEFYKLLARKGLITY